MIDDRRIIDVQLTAGLLGRAVDAIGALDASAAGNEEMRRIAILRALDAGGVDGIVDKMFAVEARLSALGEVSRSPLMSAYLASPQRCRATLLHTTARAPLVRENGTYRFESDLFFMLLMSCSQLLVTPRGTQRLH
jgi:hypothetical protein